MKRRNNEILVHDNEQSDVEQYFVLLSGIYNMKDDVCYEHCALHQHKTLKTFACNTLLKRGGNKVVVRFTPRIQKDNSQLYPGVLQKFAF